MRKIARNRAFSDASLRLHAGFGLVHLIISRIVNYALFFSSQMNCHFKPENSLEPIAIVNEIRSHTFKSLKLEPSKSSEDSLNKKVNVVKVFNDSSWKTDFK